MVQKTNEVVKSVKQAADMIWEQCNELFPLLYVFSKIFIVFSFLVIFLLRFLLSPTRNACQTAIQRI